MPLKAQDIPVNERDLVRLLVAFVNADTARRRAAAVTQLRHHPFLPLWFAKRTGVARRLPPNAALDSEWRTAQGELRQALDMIVRNREDAGWALMPPIFKRLGVLTGRLAASPTGDGLRIDVIPCLPGTVAGLWYGIILLLDDRRDLAKDFAKCPVCTGFFFRSAHRQRYCGTDCSARAQRANTVRRVQRFRKQHPGWGTKSRSP